MTFDAPLTYVYEWCRDFREDDSKYIGERFRRRFVERSRDRIVYIEHSKPGAPDDKEKVRIVNFQPDSWHLEGFAEAANVTGEYKFRALAGDRTELEMKHEITWKTKKRVPKKEMEDDLAREWADFKAALERDYTSGRSATE